MPIRLLRQVILGFMVVGLASCGFQLRGNVAVIPPLKKLYLQTSDPYGPLAHNLRDYFARSGIEVTSTPDEALTVFHIINATQTQDLLSVSGLQQTRQYSLTLTVTFELTKPNGLVLMPPTTLSENRTLTTQSDLILGGTNEQASLFQQMRFAIVYDIMNRISSRDVAALLREPKQQL